MNFQGFNARNRRNMLNQYSPPFYNYNTIANYTTDSHLDRKMKSDLASTFPEENLLDRIHSIPDPLKKNLADSVINADHKKHKKTSLNTPNTFVYENIDVVDQNSTRSDFYSSIMGITSMFSNLFGAISGVVFQKRSKSPAPEYHDCFEYDFDAEAWQGSNTEVENSVRAPARQCAAVHDAAEMSEDCRAAAVHCEDKLNRVRSLLTNKTATTSPKETKESKLRARRPKRAFVAPGSVHDCYADPFSEEEYVSLANEEYIEYFGVRNNHSDVYSEVDGPRMCVQECKSDTPVVSENDTKTEVVSVLEDKSVDNLSNNTENSISNVNVSNNANTQVENTINNCSNELENKREVISSCEDKMARLKQMLEEKRKKTQRNLNSTDFEQKPVEVTQEPMAKLKSIPTEKSPSKKFKNPNRTTDKRKKCFLRKNIKDDMNFANEIVSDDISSVENSPRFSNLEENLSKTETNRTEPIPIAGKETEYFNEVTGKFHSSSTTESEDSFQIVFSDSPVTRLRKQSDCDSEDSFIVFEESPDSCYVSHDVFGDPSDSECSDADSVDSGCDNVCKLSHNLSRTVSDLTDDSLYEEKDEVDCSVRICEEIGDDKIVDGKGDEIDDQGNSVDGEPSDKLRGLLLDDQKKLLRSKLSPKKVTFSTEKPKVHVMRVWAFAARQARAGHWERHSLDRERFKRRIADVDMAVSWVLKPQHRSRVMFQRFMPWWNALRRKEIAEKKEREEMEKLKMEEKEKQLLKMEEERLKEEQELKDAENVEGLTETGLKEKVNINGEERPTEESKTQKEGKNETESKANIKGEVSDIIKDRNIDRIDNIVNSAVQDKMKSLINVDNNDKIIVRTQTLSVNCNSEFSKDIQKKIEINVSKNEKSKIANGKIKDLFDCKVKGTVPS